MRNLFAFLFHFRGALVFGLLEVLSIGLLVTNSSYQRAAFFNSANAYAGAVLARRTQVADYFRLAALNQQLLRENAALRQQLYPPDLSGRAADSLPVGRDTLGRVVFRRNRGVGKLADSTGAVRARTIPTHPDSLWLGGQLLPARDAEFPLIPARVISQSLRQVDNYLTLNVGTADGVRPGLGVLAGAGVVGRVKAATEHFATVTSLLHSKSAVSAKLQRDGTFGTVRWPGDDPTHVLLDYIPRQNRLVLGDSVVTSGYNAIYPAGVFIGQVDYFVKEPDKNFWTVRVRLAADFTNLTYVYVVTPRRQAERDTVEARAGVRPVAAREEVRRP
ncbi:rod shape-determining protein MreC [uncultured Hymenobacter sp.]|uniref:rod shape-determining protein MreC n=1 Tax=uncultured Hymenobacter sp. TaxID=170016 RepID=UPI0035CB7C5F